LQVIERLVEVGKLQRLEAHVARVAGEGGPEVGVVQAVPGGAETARGLAEAGAPAGAAAGEALLDEGDDLLDEVVGPAAGADAVVVPAAAEPGAAVREGHHHRRYRALLHQPVEPFRDVL